MGKIIRNTIFTLIALALTAVGLHWNHQSVSSNDPVQISQTVLSAAADDVQTFPLTVSFDHPRLKLGQYQTLLVATSPKASLDIVTIYPTGNSSNPQTLHAFSDETGHYSLKFKIDDFTNLGLFETRVIAHLNGSSSEATAHFALQTLADSENATSDDQAGYVYPLLP